MMFESKYVDLTEATRLIRARAALPADSFNPLVAALEEGSIVPERFSDGRWSVIENDFFDTAKIMWPHPYTSRTKNSDADYYPSELRVLRSDVDKLWPEAQSQNGDNLISKGGRPPGDWDRAFIEATCFLLVHGVPRTQTEFIAAIQLRLGDDAPGDTQMKERLGPLYKAAKAALA